MSTDWKDTNHDSVFIVVIGRLTSVTIRAGLPDYQLEGHELRFDSCHHRTADLLGGFIEEFRDGIPTGRAPVTIRSWLTKMVHYKPVQITINAPGLAEVFIDLVVRHGPPRPPRLNCTSRLSCHLKVLIPPGTTFKLDCSYYLCVFYENIE